MAVSKTLTGSGAAPTISHRLAEPDRDLSRSKAVRRLEGMHSLRVMIVEDEPLIAMMMEALVEDVGGTALGPFATLPAAIRALESNADIDVALLDCNLGRENSWPVADALAARDIPFAFTSGQGAKEITQRFANRPVFAKPVDEERLKRFLQQHIRQG